MSHFHLLKYIACIAAILLAFAMSQAAFAQYPGLSDPGARSTGGGSATGGLAPVEGGVDGGIIPIGSTAQVVVRFRNDGSQPVETGLIRLYPSSNVSANVALNQCEEEPLPSGAECAIALSVQGLQAGAWRVEMLMSHSGRTRLVTATLSGSVESSGESSDKLTSDVETIPDQLDFGSLTGNQTLIEPVILRNITSTAIRIEDIYIDTSDQTGFSLKTECDTLQAGQACIAIVTWSPNLEGRSSGVLVIEHSGPAALASVPLTGEYEPDEVSQADVFPKAVPGKGLLVSSQTELDYGADIETASTITVSLVNAGDVPLTIEDIKISGSDNGLSFKGDGCLGNTVLDPIEACPLTVSWSPTRIGSVFDDVQIKHDGARGVLVLPIRGTAIAAVSQDQKAIILSDDRIISSVPDSDSGSPASQSEAAGENKKRMATPASTGFTINNAQAALDGYKITSFSPTRAIINGPGGSRLIYDSEEVVIGGIPWFIIIQQNGIEFLHQGKRVLLLFDRSLSSINRVSTSSAATPADG